MFKNNAEEAVKFYVSLFDDGEILTVTRYSEEELKALERLPESDRPGPAGQIKMIEFKINKQCYLAGNGGPHFNFNDGVSFYVGCDNQEELDFIWDKLADGGQIVECGWIIDRFGMRWQVAPAILDVMLTDSDPRKRDRVSKAIYASKKLDFKTLIDAYNGNKTEYHGSTLPI
jgi:predicted 3-demethylubiquinone-9 3-methyltransferase (glyoxalase superfamily)